MHTASNLLRLLRVWHHAVMNASTIPSATEMGEKFAQEKFE